MEELVLLLLVGRICGALGCSGQRSSSEWFTNKTSPEAGMEAGYIASQRPRINEIATEVIIDIQLTSIVEINTMTQSLELSGFYRIMWTDQRLTFPGTSDGGCFDVVNIPSSEIESIWTPDLYVENSIVGAGAS